MAVLETAIMFDNETLVEKSFYNSSINMDKEVRANLISAISGLALDCFDDDLVSFTFGEHVIISLSKYIEHPKDPNIRNLIKIYSIIQKDTNEKTVRKYMGVAIAQFLNRFPLVHIFTKKKKAFKKFPDRLDIIFKDLCISTEDRFKNLF